MSRLQACLFAVIGTLTCSAQDLRAIIARDAAIDSLYKAERYAEVAKAIDAQLKAVAGTTWADSLHRYVYKAGRAYRQMQGVDAGIRIAEDIHTRVAARDDVGHRLAALADLSWTYYDAGRIDQCIRVDSMAVALVKVHGELPAAKKGKAYHYLGFDHSVQGDHERALRCFLAAEAEYGRDGTVDALQRAESCTGAGASCWHLGRMSEATSYYRQAIDLLAGRDDPEALTRKGSVYGNLGIMWQSSGDLPRARSYYQLCLTCLGQVIAKATTPSMRDEAIVNRARTYLNIATIYFSLGDAARARELLELSWNDRARVFEPDDPQLLAVQERMADLELGNGSLEKAEQLTDGYLRACERRFGVRSAEYVRSCAKLGRIAMERGDMARADSLFARSLELNGRITDPATDPERAGTLKQRSELYAKSGRYAEAMADLERARRILVRVHGEGHYQVAGIDVRMAKVAFLAGDTAEARRSADAALGKLKDRVDHLRSAPDPLHVPDPELLPDAIYWRVRSQRGLGPPQGPPRRWNADIDLAVEALRRNHRSLTDDASRLALMASQKRLFDLALDLAYEDHERTGAESDIERFLELSESDRSILLRDRLNTFTGIRFAHVPDSVLDREQAVLRALDIDRNDRGTTLDLERKEQDLRDLLRMLRRDHPRYYALRYGDAPVSLAGARRALLGTDRSLLVYATTPEHVYMLTVGAEEAALVRVDADGLAGQVGALRAAIAARDTAASRPIAALLYERIFAPVADRLRTTGLLVVPDGDLHLLNLELLPTGARVGSGARPELLLDRFAITGLLSVTTAVRFAGLKDDRTDGALAVAPGFTDEVKQEYLDRMRDPLLVDRRFLSFVRQPFAVRTANDLGDLLSARVMVGAAANERAFREQAGKYGIIHLGTHADLNAIAPMYSYLVLDKDGEGMDADNDGYLHAYEIFDLDLRAELAVLTACETGMGREDPGEGVRSLAYGFAYAGCPSLVMSLWNIDERSSSEIITAFYEALADGMPKDEALRRAKLAYLDRARDEVSMPYYWAGLVLVGDPAPVRSIGHRRFWPWVIAGCAGVAGLVVLMRRRRRVRPAS